MFCHPATPYPHLTLLSPRSPRPRPPPPPEAAPPPPHDLIPQQNTAASVDPAARGSAQAGTTLLLRASACAPFQPRNPVEHQQPHKPIIVSQTSVKGQRLEIERTRRAVLCHPALLYPPPFPPHLVLEVHGRPRCQKLLRHRRMTFFHSANQRRLSKLRRAAALRQAPPFSSTQVPEPLPTLRISSTHPTAETRNSLTRFCERTKQKPGRHAELCSATQPSPIRRRPPSPCLLRPRPPPLPQAAP